MGVLVGTGRSLAIKVHPLQITHIHARVRWICTYTQRSAFWRYDRQTIPAFSL